MLNNNRLVFNKLLYFNFSNFKSIRDLQTQIVHNSKLNRLINISSVSELARKNA